MSNERVNVTTRRQDVSTDWGNLAFVARTLHDGRVNGYPALVTAGKLDKAEADRRIAIMRAAAEIWRAAWECRLPDRAIVAPKGQEIDRCDVVGELLRARAVTSRHIERFPADGKAMEQRDSIDALIDWHRRFVDGPIFCVRITLQIRAIGASTERKAA
jgi:hypothetical protein